MSVYCSGFGVIRGQTVSLFATPHLVQSVPVGRRRPRRRRRPRGEGAAQHVGLAHVELAEGLRRRLLLVLLLILR